MHAADGKMRLTDVADTEQPVKTCDSVSKNNKYCKYAGIVIRCYWWVKICNYPFANENNIEFAWQTRFYDRIVRDQNEFNYITKYIENNVANWHLDWRV